MTQSGHGLIASEVRSPRPPATALALHADRLFECTIFAAACATQPTKLFQIISRDALVALFGAQHPVEHQRQQVIGIGAQGLVVPCTGVAEATESAI